MVIKQAKRRILITVGIGTFMAALDSSIVNMVLPNISAYFKTSLSTIEWAVMAYLLVISSLLLAFGRLGDMYGHKRIYMIGFIGFAIGSFLCGISQIVLTLIISRVVQAVGAGMLMAMGPAIVTDAVEPKERGKALSVSAISVAVALAVGPVIGGLLTTAFGWQSIFYINIPIGLFGVFQVLKNIPESQEQVVQPFDMVGAMMVFLALICILLPLSLVERYGWGNPFILLTLCIGLVLVVGFIVWERRTAFPLFDLSLFQNRLFLMSNVAALFNYMAQFTIVLLIPYYLQRLLGLAPTQAGFLYLPMPVTMMLVAPISGTLSDRMDSRYISAAGMVVLTSAMLVLSTLKADSANIHLITGLILAGLGIGLFQTPNNSAIMGSVPNSKRGIASGMLATMRNVGMVLGVAISGAIFTSSHQELIDSFRIKGVSGLELDQMAFVGAFKITYIIGALFALGASITSLAKGSTRNSESSIS